MTELRCLHCHRLVALVTDGCVIADGRNVRAAAVEIECHRCGKVSHFDVFPTCARECLTSQSAASTITE